MCFAQRNRQGITTNHSARATFRKMMNKRTRPPQSLWHLVVEVAGTMGKNALQTIVCSALR